MAGFFESARDFNVGRLSVENVTGNYTTERHTLIEEEEVGRETYDQEGAVGVVNGGGKFVGTVNHAGGSSVPRKQKPCLKAHLTRRYSPAQYREEETNKAEYRSGLGPARDNASSNDQPNDGRPPAASFKNAAHFGVSSMEVKNVGGDRIDKDSKDIHKKYIHERVYNQRGAVGVVNGRGTFSGTINYGGDGNASKLSRRDSESEDDEESQSDNDSSSDDDYAGTHYNQSHAIGVANDHGKFIGNINYNIANQTKPGKARPKREVVHGHGQHFVIPGARLGHAHGNPQVPRPLRPSTTMPSQAPGNRPHQFGTQPHGSAERNPFRRMASGGYYSNSNGLNTHRMSRSYLTPESSCPSPLQSGTRSAPRERHQYF